MELLMKNSDKCEMPDYRDTIEIIENGKKEKLFRKDINADLVNRCLYSLARSIMDNDIYPFDEFARKEVMRNVMINYMRGISTREGLELIERFEERF
jgi:hypothetical protein